jgi:alpha-tubulin suppressor-like RCC1 family protein
MALKQDGTVWTWGNNPAGELGNGSFTYEALPTQVVGPNGVGTLNSIAAIMGSEAHNLALASDGTVWATTVLARWALGRCLRGSL